MLAPRELAGRRPVTTMHLLKRIEVWRALSTTRALRYNCVQSIETGQFRVCTADFVEPGGTLDADQARYFVERILDWTSDSAEQPEWFCSVESTIAAHDKAFEN